METGALFRACILLGLALLIGISSGFLTGLYESQSAPRAQQPDPASPTAGPVKKNVNALPDHAARNPLSGDMLRESLDSSMPSQGNQVGQGPNFAARSNGATASGGVNPELLIDGNTTDFSGVKGFAYTNWTTKPTPAMLVALKQPTPINTIRFLLWDLDERYFRYKLEASPEAQGENWKVLADCTENFHQCRSWQVVSFMEQLVSRIRLTGTFNSENDGFHVIEIQAYLLPKDMKITPGAMQF